MTEHDSPIVQPFPIDEALGFTTDLPLPLPGDPRRQAVPSIQGAVYQAWRSIDAWLQLADVNEVIYLEGAEDFDVVNSATAIAVQVKKNECSISLGNAVLLNMYSFLNILSFVFNALESAYLHQINNAQYCINDSGYWALPIFSNP